MRAHASFLWFLILTNSILLIMVLINSWTILVKHKKWKTWPLTLFYLMAFVAVLLRLLTLIFLHTNHSWIVSSSLIQPVAKASVGLIEAWMIFELAMRFRNINIKCLNFMKCIFLVLILLMFIISTIIISTAVKKSSDHHQTMVNASKPYAYIYLSLFFVMLIVNIDLIWQTKKYESEIMAKNAMKKEKVLLFTVLIIFELSYFVRFLTDIMGAGMTDDG